MNYLKSILILCSGLVALSCPAQLSKLVPKSMSHQSTANNGSKTAAHVEIVFSEPLTGVEVVRDSKNSTTDTSFGQEAGKVHAKALAMPAQGVVAKKVTVVHPDFEPCVIVFDSIGFKEPVVAGEHYLIEVEVPGATLVEANKAYYNLDFPSAEAKYNAYLAEGSGADADMVNQRLAVIQELETAYNQINEKKTSTSRTDLFRCMKAAEMIQDRTHSMKAYELAQDFRRKLGGDKKTARDDDGATRLKIDTVFLHAADNRPMSDARLPKVDGQPYYSWINIKVNLDNVTFTGGDQFIPAERIDGDYRLYVGKGLGSADSIVVRHSDCIPFVLNLSDYGYGDVKPASVYEVRFNTPPATLIEADRAFGNLNFVAAKMLYEQMLQNSGKYDDETLLEVSQRLANVKPLADNERVRQWKDFRKMVHNAEKYDRDELTGICNQLSKLAEEFGSYGVPGMDHKAQFYAKAAKDYREAVYLTITAYLSDEKGNPLFDTNGDYIPFDAKEICLMFDNVWGVDNFPVPMKLSQKGLYKAYLPDSVSSWLRSHPNKKMKVRAKRSLFDKKYIGDKFEIYLDGDSRSFGITQYYKDIVY